MKKLFLLISFLTVVLLQNQQAVAQMPINVSIGYTNVGTAYNFYPIINIVPGVDSTIINDFSFTWQTGGVVFGTGYSATYDFSDPGSYTVCLSYSGACCANTICENIVVTPNVECNVPFTATENPDGSYTLTATPPFNTPIASYSWQFAGMALTGSTVTIPANAVAAGDSLLICLHTTTIDGCVGTYCSALSGGGNTSSCQAAFSATTNVILVVFNNFSQVAPGEVATYSWSFGDGTTSTEANPTHEYTIQGDYDVCLTITTSSGCTDTNCQWISVNNLVIDTLTCNAGFYYIMGNASVAFQNYSSSPSWNNTYTWTFGDGTTSNEINPVHTYNALGTYEVCLTITTVPDPLTEQCSDIFCQSIYFGDSDYSLCGTVGIVGTTDSSSVYTYEVYIIQYDPVTDILTAIDTLTLTTWGNYGNYCFDNLTLGDTYYVKAALTPNSAGYDSHLPTYYGNSLSWQFATAITLDDFVPNIADIMLIAGENPGGAGFVGGVVSDGAGRSTSAGMAGTQVILYDANNVPVAVTYTDADGNYQFTNIPTGNYFVVVEYLGATSDQIAVNANPGVVAANFVKNDDHFTGALSLGTNTIQATNVSIRPTLLASNATMTIESQAIIQQVRVVDMLGSIVYLQNLNNNNTSIQLNNWAKGYYICEVLDVAGNTHRTKIVIQ